MPCGTRSCVGWFQWRQQFPATFVLRLQFSRREDLQPASSPVFISARLNTELVPVSNDFISPVVEIFRFLMAFL